MARYRVVFTLPSPTGSGAEGIEFVDADSMQEAIVKVGLQHENISVLSARIDTRDPAPSTLPPQVAIESLAKALRGSRGAPASASCGRPESRAARATRCCSARGPSPATRSSPSTSQACSVIPNKETRGIIVDLFAGGGGASVGIEAATGRHVDIALNHDPIALAVHKANHPGTHHLRADVFDVNPRRAVQGHTVDILWASPDCTHFSVAKGGRPRKQSIRSLAWAVVRWARETKPRLIFIENVAEFQGWGPLDENGNPIKARMGETFRRWKRDLEALGYTVDFRILDASLYGAPTRRRRLFLVARRRALHVELVRMGLPAEVVVALKGA